MIMFPRCRHRYAWYRSVHMHFCASSDRMEYAPATNCFPGWAQEIVKIYCTKSVEMLPFYRDVFLVVHIVADDLHNCCYHIWCTPMYILLHVVCTTEREEMVEAEILWSVWAIAHVLFDLGLLWFFRKGPASLGMQWIMHLLCFSSIFIGNLDHGSNHN